MRKKPEYVVWNNMKARCRNPKNPRWEDYGGRGITVYREWAESFPAFLAHMGRRPSKSHQLERLDNDRGYEPGNVVWTTRKQNCRNRRSTVFVEVDGQRMCLKEAAERSGIAYKTVFRRVTIMGWTLERALNTPTLSPWKHSRGECSTRTPRLSAT
jgi:hypothetical protein